MFVEAGLELDCSDGMIVILPNVGTLDLPSSGPPKKLLIVATGAFDEAIGSGPAFFDGHIHKIKFVGSDVTGFKLSGKLRGADQGGGYLWDARLDVFMEQTP